MPASETKPEQSYGIGAVAKLTGLTDHTIRVWEKRYQAVVAQRAPNGRRIYTAADVEKLRVLKILTDKGLSIGMIAARSIDELRDEIGNIDELTASPAPDRVAVAVLGDDLPGLLTTDSGFPDRLDVVVADRSEDRFSADLARHKVDVVVLQSAVLNDDTNNRMRRLMSTCNASRGVVVYAFGRSSDIELARDANVVVVRSPVNADEIVDAVFRTYAQPQQRGSSRADEAMPAGDSDWEFEKPPAPRRFTNQQLSNLANMSSAIECECPQHLAQLVGQLSAFEIYSAQCANRDDDDAALHRYLHQTTAEARLLIEIALERVAAAEGLTY